MRPIVSIRDLAWRLRTPAARLREISDEIAKDMWSHYDFWSEMDAKTGKVRHFRAPKPELKEIQRRINDQVLSDIPLSGCAHGGVRGRSTLTNASEHLGKEYLITMDVKSFFPNVRHYVVYRLFRNQLAFGRDVARLLTRLTTVAAQLPQGAPTSTAIANILLTTAVDMPVTGRAGEIGAANTRFVDDLAFSGSDPQSLGTLISEAARGLSRRRLSIWRRKMSLGGKSKLKIMPNHDRQQVTGLIVNSRSGPSVPREYRERVRAAIRELGTLPAGPRRRAAESSIRGRIQYVAATNPGAAMGLRQYLERVAALDR